MLDLNYQKFPESDTVRVTGTIPVSKIIEMMSQDRATRFICHALMNIIKGHDLQPLGVDYRMAYLCEVLRAEEPNSITSASFDLFQLSTVRQFIEMVKGISEDVGDQITWWSNTIHDDVSRMVWLRKVLQHNPDACFKVDVLCSTDGFNPSVEFLAK